ncbi:DNA primase [Yersinia phage vB_YenP_ISAO8]|uniref:DNA primase n=1 Tax=Yersinia phage vB_YenP_ISAO8 TaxID=1675027 RepID=A0A0H4THC2_9CAUD|nr:DNA primase [Yersinia phage vB_YenP_ISAO8]AKQ07708.1 DNA primase [Yersinia phage vB_YenP_ISAO8]
MKPLEDREWLPWAKLLGHNEDDKIIHNGCGTRPSLYIKNEADGLWAYCHRCRRSGNYSKTYQRIKVKAPEKTGWFPKTTMPFINAVAESPAQFASVLATMRLSKYVSLLTYSPDTMRVYLPDVTKQWLGLDVTGAATARWYSPTRKAVAVWHGTSPVMSVRVCHRLEDYLQSVRNGEPALITFNPGGRKFAIAWLVEHKVRSALADKNINPAFMKELKAICSTTFY